MKNKKIAVLLKYFRGELNPFDGSALECALETGSKEIIALSMAPMSALNALQGLTRLGIKVVLISDGGYAGSDTQATSFILSEALKRLQPDLIFCGRQSVDGDTAQVPPMLAQRLGFCVKTKAIAFDGERVTLRNGEKFIPQTNEIITFEKIRTLRFPSIFSKQKEIEIWDNSILELSMDFCGFTGSPTRVIKSYENNVGRRDCRFCEVEDLPKLIENALLKNRVEQIWESDEKLEIVHFVGNISSVTKSIAKEAMVLPVAGKTAEALAEEIKKLGAKIVLWEDREDYKILASKTAVILGAGICADCVSFRVQDGKLVMTRPALGGNVTADIVCESDVTFATVRTAKKDGSDVIFSVGRGAVSQVEQIKRLANQYGAEVCCSRSVADSGILPYETQVGLTGRTVSPKIYVAFGISGAVQHTCAVTGATTVIAVNTDKQARIFDYADYGIVSKVEDLFRLDAHNKLYKGA